MEKKHKVLIICFILLISSVCIFSVLMFKDKKEEVESVIDKIEYLEQNYDNVYVGEGEEDTSIVESSEQDEQPVSTVEEEEVSGEQEIVNPIPEPESSYDTTDLDEYESIAIAVSPKFYYTQLNVAEYVSTYGDLISDELLDSIKNDMNNNIAELQDGTGGAGYDDSNDVQEEVTVTPTVDDLNIEVLDSYVEKDSLCYIIKFTETLTNKVNIKIKDGKVYYMDSNVYK